MQVCMQHAQNVRWNRCTFSLCALHWIFVMQPMVRNVTQGMTASLAVAAPPGSLLPWPDCATRAFGIRSVHQFHQAKCVATTHLLLTTGSVWTREVSELLESFQT
jgi:hypothetical protein